MTRYQYETSPKKLEPDDSKINIQTHKQKEQAKKEIRKKAQENAKRKYEVFIKKRNLVVVIASAFVVLLAISYRNSLINESFIEVKELKNELSLLEKENEQLSVTIESSINLKNIEQAAQEKLGMQKLTPEQKIYVTLPKKDYVESATEIIEKKDTKNIFQKLFEIIKGE